MGGEGSGALTAKRVAIIDDEPALAGAMRRMLEARGYEALVFTDPEPALAEITRGSGISAVLLDVGLPGRSGLDVLAEIKQARPDVEVIMVTGDETARTAVRALRLGAYDYLVKSHLDPDLVAAAVARATEHQGLVVRMAHLERQVGAGQRFPEIITRSPAMASTLALLEQVAATSATVLLRGESGTGKEVFARLLHARSRRSRGPFVPVTCSGLPDGLLESELFGHERGAFTGAQSARRGVFEEGSGGTVFLDEIGDAPLSTQLKLLRTLQEREVRPLGSSTARPVDVRIVAATHVDLEQAIEEGRFRQDLYFRLNVFILDLPPLRARIEDIPALVAHFVSSYATQHGRTVQAVTPDAMERLITYPWPGNVRELEHAIERAVILAGGDELGVECLPPVVTRKGPTGAVASVGPSPATSGVGSELLDLPYAEAKAKATALFERSYAEHALSAVDGNLSAAARRAGLDRSNFRRLLNRHGLHDRDSE